MGDEKAKISFGFSRVIKKTSIVQPSAPKTDAVQFIDCVVENSIKVIGGDTNNKPKKLVIPLKDDNLLRNNLLATLKSRTAATQDAAEDVKSEAKKEEGQEQAGGEDEQEKKPLTLDEMAAKEILEDLKKKQEVSNGNKILTLPLASDTLTGKEESTLDDYENIPISDFGKAMLRGMGWVPETGIGKNSKVVRPASPSLRPKGMGLGADKMFKKDTAAVKPAEEIALKTGTCVKVLQGQHKHLYGKIEGFEEVSGRLIVRLALSNSLVTLNELVVEGVKLEEYNKNSKVINVSKYNEYKDKEIDSKKDITKEKSDGDASVNSGVNSSRRKDERDYSDVNNDNRSKKSSSDIKVNAEKKSKKYSSDSSEHSLQEESGSKSSYSKHKRSSPEVKSKSRRGRSRSLSNPRSRRDRSRSLSNSRTRRDRSRSSSNSSNAPPHHDSHKKRSNKHKKHKLSRKHKSRSRSRSRHDKFKRKHRHRSPGKKGRRD